MSKLITGLKFSGLALCASVALMGAPAMAADKAPTPPAQEWSFNGPFGTFDRTELQRGFQVYKSVCAACHSMQKLSYRNLAALGYNEDEIKAIAAEYTVMDGPDDEGEMFERPARPSDRFKSPYANEKQARYANNGAYPPDMSLIVKARKYGPDYMYALLTGYSPAPDGVEVMDGMYWNDYYTGHQIAMAAPLAEGVLQYEDGTEATTEQMARDVSAFLTWASEPTMEDRKRMGVMVILFLIVFAGIMYGVKRKAWEDVDH